MGMELPWLDEAIFTRVLMHEANKETFHKPDIFHTVNLGVGKSWAASVLTFLQEMCPGTSIEARFQSLTCEFLAFCKEPGMKKQ